MSSRKGRSCPSCGANGFRPRGAVHICSNCKAIGWIAVPDPMTGPRGQNCYGCETKTLRKIFETAKLSIFYCATCKATMIET
jgi:hypothetical protein